MIPLMNDRSSLLEGLGADDSADSPRRYVRIALTLYLLPVVAIVLSIGVLAIVVEAAFRGLGRVKGPTRQGKSSLAKVSQPHTSSRVKPHFSRRHSKVRVNR